jgi:hypothetical protein
MRYLGFLVCLAAGGAEAAVLAGQFTLERDGAGRISGYPIQYLSFEVAEPGEVTIDLLSYEFYEQYFDPYIWLFRDSAKPDAGDLVAVNDDVDLPIGSGDGSVHRFDSYLKLVLDRGRYLLAIDVYPSDLQDVLTGFAADNADRLFGSADYADYQVTVTGGGIEQLQFVQPEFTRPNLSQLEPTLSYVRGLGDIDGDGVAEIAVSTRYRTVRTFDLTGEQKSSALVSSNSTRRTADIEILPDYNGNGTPEVTVLGEQGLPNDVVDSLTGERLIDRLRFDGLANGVDVEPLQDMDGNGVVELASLFTRDEPGGRVRIKDARSQELINALQIRRGQVARDIEPAGDYNRDGVEDLAILTQSRSETGNGHVVIRDSLTGDRLWDRRLSEKWNVHRFTLVTDVDGDGFRDIAVLRTAKDDARGQVAVFSTSTGQALLGTSRLPDGYFPIKMLRVDDYTGNGADELVVFMRDLVTRQEKAIVRDSKTGKYIRSIYYPNASRILDVTVIDDINGNGAPEIAILGTRNRNGLPYVMIKDSKTGELLVASLDV